MEGERGNLSSIFYKILVQYMDQHRAIYYTELIDEYLEDNKDHSFEEAAENLTSLLFDAEIFDEDKRCELTEALVMKLTESKRYSLKYIQDEISMADDIFMEGANCLALLAEDNDWHEAKIVRSLGEDAYEVVFTEFDKPQNVVAGQIILRLPEDNAIPSNMLCQMCERQVFLTRHHLIPRELHAKYLQKGFSQDLLNMCIDICRQCHIMIHKQESNLALAQNYNTLDKLMAHDGIMKWIAYARKLKATNRIPISKRKKK